MNLKTVSDLKGLYEKDFYLWMMGNLKLLKKKAGYQLLAVIS